MNDMNMNSSPDQCMGTESAPNYVAPAIEVLGTVEALTRGMTTKNLYLDKSFTAQTPKSALTFKAAVS
jgi:hypothetical protein